MDDDFEVGAPDDFSEFSPEGQVAIAAALERVRNGTARTVPHDEILGQIELQRLAALKTG